MNPIEESISFSRVFSEYGRHPPVIAPGDVGALNRFVGHSSEITLEGIACRLNEVSKKTLPEKRDPTWGEDFGWNLRRVNAEKLNALRTDGAHAGILVGVAAAGVALGAGITLAATGGLASIPAVVGFGWGTSQATLAVYGVGYLIADESQTVFEMERRRDRAQRAMELAALTREKELASHGILSSDLFLHGECFSEAEVEEIEAISFCSISKEYPLVPVFSPHDVERRHPYDRSAILQHLDKIERRIAPFRKFDTDEARATIRELESTADPLRGPYFTADQLVFDIDHARARLPVLRKIHARLHSELGRNLDTVQRKALDQILMFYEYTYGEKTNLHLVELFSNCKALHMPPEEKDAIANVFHNIQTR